MYECPSCGAGLEFNPKTQKLDCKYCKSSFDPKDLEEKLKDAKGDKGFSVENSKDENGKEKVDVYEAIVYRCTQCGAELITTDETIATFCSYCGSSAVLEKRNETKVAPSYVIPFTKSKEECEQAYKNKIKRAFFAPSDMLKTQQVEKIRGIYMPYWVYSFDKDGEQSNTGSKYSHRVGDYVYYDDYLIVTNIKAGCDGVSHDAASNFADNLSEAIAPFSMKEKKDFSPTYLSGFYADSEDVNGDVYREQCNEIANKQAANELKKDHTYSKYGCNPKVYMKPKDTKLGLFPVYFLATKNKAGDRISYAVVNGQTGKVAAEIPIDFKKYLIFSLILAVGLFFLFNGFLTLTPTKIIVISIIFNLISLIISNSQMNKIIAREKMIDDKGNVSKNGKKVETTKSSRNTDSKTNVSNIIVGIIVFMIMFAMFIGYASEGIRIPIIPIFGMGIITIYFVTGKKRNNNKQKAKFSEKAPKLLKPFIGLIIAIAIFIWNPVSDVYYYAGAIASIIMTIWSFFDLIKEINLLTPRKLPQLGRRGGDENA